MMGDERKDQQGAEEFVLPEINHITLKAVVHSPRYDAVHKQLAKELLSRVGPASLEVDYEKEVDGIWQAVKRASGNNGRTGAVKEWLEDFVSRLRRQ